MKILITGGAGFLGSVITEKLLNSNHEVTVLDNMMYNQTSSIVYAHNKLFKFMFGDVRDTELLKKLVLEHDLIIPLAAIVGFPACERDKDLATAINYEHVRVVCEVAKEKTKGWFTRTPIVGMG